MCKLIAYSNYVYDVVLLSSIMFYIVCRPSSLWAVSLDVIHGVELGLERANE